MTSEADIEASIEGHAARNMELLKLLREKGVSVNESRSVDHHFWANSQEDAALLAKRLYERGYLVLAINPLEDGNGPKLWNVEARMERTPAEAASPALTEELVRLAAEYDSSHDGWGTEV